MDLYIALIIMLLFLVHDINSKKPETPSAPDAKEDTTVALFAYLTPLLFGVGIVIAIIMHRNKKTKLGSYHLRQSLGLLLTIAALLLTIASPLKAALMLLWFLLCFFIPGVILLIIPLGIAVFVLVLWVMGLLSAINGQQKPIPVVGEYYQKWFAGAFV